MLSYAARRLAAAVPVLLVVSLAVFALVHLTPGDPAIAIAGENASAADVEATRQRLGLNDPLHVQYGRWVAGLVRGDLGTSLFSTRSVATAVWDRFPVTIALTLAAMVVALVISVPAGILAAIRRGRWQDRVATGLTSAGIAIPNFWLGILLILAFALYLPLFPAVGYVPLTASPGAWARHITLPAITLGVAAAAETTRQLRSSLSETLQRDHVRTARAMGLPGRSVVGKHALKNAAIPVVTVIGFQVAFLLGGAVVVERVFGIPGLGDLAIDAVLRRDIPVIQGIVIVTATAILLINLAVDLTYAWLDPRVRVR